MNVLLDPVPIRPDVKMNSFFSIKDRGDKTNTRMKLELEGADNLLTYNLATLGPIGSNDHESDLRPYIISMDRDQSDYSDLIPTSNHKEFGELFADSSFVPMLIETHKAYNGLDENEKQKVARYVSKSVKVKYDSRFENFSPSSVQDTLSQPLDYTALQNMKNYKDMDQLIGIKDQMWIDDYDPSACEKSVAALALWTQTSFKLLGSQALDKPVHNVLQNGKTGTANELNKFGALSDFFSTLTPKRMPNMAKALWSGSGGLCT